MKRILLTLTALLFLCTASAVARTYSVGDIPNVQLADRTRYTSNPDGILSQSAVSAIDRACDSLRTSGRAQIAVVAIDDIATDDVFSFAVQLFSEWGVGTRSNSNGLGIILVKDKGEIRFITGDGLEGILPDAVCKRIQQQYMVAPFRAGDFDTGMVQGITALASILSGGEASFDDTDDEAFEAFLGLLFGGLMLFVMFVVIWAWRAKKCPRCGKHKLQQTESVMLASNRRYDDIERIFVCRNCGNRVVRREKIYKDNGGGGTFIGGGRGGFGGGSIGGGFGGGHFGGGGAGSKF